jgi:predicted ATP-grasp superfamily ATP-dependent carboligase
LPDRVEKNIGMFLHRYQEIIDMKSTMPIAKNKVFVLSLFDTGVGVIRSLGRAGVSVIGLDANPVMPGFASRYCEAKLSPDPVHAPEALFEFLMKEAEHLDEPGILMPAADAYVLFIARYREELHQRFLFTLPPDSVLEAMVNKRRQYELAEQIGMPLAKTYYPESMSEVAQIKNELEYPVFIKPYFGHLWREVYGSAHKGFKVGSPQELVTRYEEIFRNNLQALVQSIIIGPDSNLYEVSFYIGKMGNQQAVFTHRKIHQYPPEFGVCTCAESIYYPELVDLGAKLMRGFGYRGISSTEFKRDDRDGQLKLIELNPRFCQQNILAADCGVNFPLIEYLDLTDEYREAVDQFKIGVKWLDPVIDFPSFWQYYRRHETTPWQWLKTWGGVRSFPVFAPDDLGPYFKKYEYGKKFMALPFFIFHHW